MKAAWMKYLEWDIDTALIKKIINTTKKRRYIYIYKTPL